MLATTIADADPKSRVGVLFTLALRFSDAPATLGSLEARVYDEVVELLARDQPASVRAELSHALALVASGPEKTVRDLARDRADAVAAPVLRQSPLLGEKDLIDIAALHGQGHLGAIAQRRHLGAKVTDVIVARGTWPVLRTISANLSARFGRSALSRLAQAAEGDGVITVALLKRRDTPPDVAQKLVGTFKLLARDHRLEQQGEDSGLDLTSIVGAPEPQDEPARPQSDMEIAEARVETMSRYVRLTEHDVLWCLDEGRWTDAVVVVAKLAGEPVAHVLRAFDMDGPDDALKVMRLAGLKWSIVARMLRFRASGAAFDDAFGSRAAYEGLSQEGADKAWRLAKFRSIVTVIPRH